MSIIDSLISNLAPHDCVGCGYEGAIICVQCAKNFEKIPDRCYRCRKSSPQSRTCQGCRGLSNLDSVHAATIYNDTAKDLVWQLKFQGVQAAAAVMSGAMIRMALFAAEDTCLVPVPTASSRARRRGYDQAKLLTRELSKRSRFPYNDCLRRSGQTHQVGSSRQERVRQLKTAFRVKKQPIYQNVIIVDDVITTGATLEAAAASLRQCGVQNISALVFAQPPLVGNIVEG